MFDALRAYLSRIDERPVEQIDHDIDEELATHLFELEHDLTLTGLSPDAARREALSRFGNPQTHKRRCRDVALMERRMKTYAQTIVTIACGLLLGVVTTSVWFNQQSASAAIADMNQRMDELTRSLTSRVPAGANASVEPAAPASSVYISGSPVTRPGHYQMPAGGLTLRRLLAVSGVDPRFVKEVVVRHRNEHTPELPHETMLGRQLADPTGSDIPLQAEDLITVLEADPTKP